MTADRGASEVVGFVLVFSVIVASVGVLYVAGFGTLADLRASQQHESATRTFVALDRSFQAVERGDAPGRSAEILLGGGSLRVAPGDVLSVVAVDADGNSLSETTVSGALVYEHEDTAITYASGAVFRRAEGAGVATVEGPLFSCSDDRAIVSLVALNATGDTTSVAGGGSVLVVGRTVERSVVFPAADLNASDVSRVKVTPSGPNAAGWRDYLRSQGWTGTDTYVCETDRLVVRRTTLGVRLLA